MSMVLRAEIALAAKVLPIARPLADFVAVNPLSGFESLPFGEAVARASALYGCSGYLRPEQYRALYTEGRITDADLRAALHRLWPQLDDTQRERALGSLVDATPLTMPPAMRRALTPVERYDQTHGTELTGTVNDHVVRWCSVFADQGQASWTLPGRHRGLYGAWHHLVVHDRAVPADVRTRLAAAPATAADAVQGAIDTLGAAAGSHRALFEAELTALPGWAAHLRWRSNTIGDVDLIDYLALRLTYEMAVLPEGAAARLGAPPANPPSEADDQLAVWQEAFEQHYRAELLALLRSDGTGTSDTAPPTPAPTPMRPAAQVVCCIDVRSEGLRRHLEALGPYETLGFAGFFAVAIWWRSLAGGDPLGNCPALINPRHAVGETITDGSLAAFQLAAQGQAALDDALHLTKDTPGTAFVLAEAAGWLTGPAAAARTIAPRRWRAWRQRTVDAATPRAHTHVDLSRFALGDRVVTARTALSMMGLTTNFARLVVMCGHTSETAANPYEAGLRCGACGGHGGGPNARVLAAVLNDPEVRAALAADGLVLPDDTVVIAAEHDTTTDEVTILDPHLVPTTHHEDLRQLGADLDAAGAALAAERCATLPGSPGVTLGSESGSAPATANAADARAGCTPELARADAQRRSSDWGEAFPEWGLAANAAMIVGPRSMTEGVDLGRRVFLHSYVAHADPGASGLETILTAPVVVAQWINCQYYFSTTDPHVFGAGTKTVHNPVGTVGVFAGRGGDLRMGLPIQSVAAGSTMVHEPLRLLVVVQAPRRAVNDIVERNPSLRALLVGHWITLVTRDDERDDWHEWTAHRIDQETTT